MKISRKKFGIVMGISIGFVMSLSLSFIMLYANAGFIEGFWGIWMQSFAVSFTFSTPIALIAFPIIEKLLLSVFVVEL